MRKKVSLLSMLFIAAWAIQDVIREYQKGETLSHLYFELAVAAISVGWIYYLWAENFRKADKLENLRIHIEKLTEESGKWREQNSKLINGLSDSIHHQLVEWGLTKAEREVALLLLKGLSFKDIAEIRSTSEKTTRQQALMVYQKSRLPGRAELSAFFFEDLLAAERT